MTIRSLITIFSAYLLLSGASQLVFASNTTLDGKRVVHLLPVEQVQIELPDQSHHDFGWDFKERLTTRLTQSQKFIVWDPSAFSDSQNQRSRMLTLDPPEFAWSGGLTPAAQVQIEVQGMSFTTGTRGDKMFYGFSKDFKTPYNDGAASLENEFPIAAQGDSSRWFSPYFEKKGSDPWDSRSGLDLGDGIKIDVLFAWLQVKYAKYKSQLELLVKVKSPLTGVELSKEVNVKGEGFFYDISGGYQKFGAAIRIARSDAMLRAFKNAISATSEALEPMIAQLPLTATLDQIINDGGNEYYLLGTGSHSEVQPGVQFTSLVNPTVIFKVLKSNGSGSVAQVVSGDGHSIARGSALIQVLGHSSTALSARSLRIESGDLEVQTAMTEEKQSIETEKSNFALPKIDKKLLPKINRIKALFKKIVGIVFLPYRLWRQQQYDQTYHQDADFADQSRVRKADDWSKELFETSWAKKTGLSFLRSTAQEPEAGPVVAVIDSGVDYNHPAIHGRLATFPDLPDRYGRDFISGDTRPYDDSYHGTQIASVITGLAPQARILPIKVFNPYGVTHSAAIFRAFQYAIERGAKIIVCAWATPIESQALRSGLEAAQDAGVVVVTAAGEQGKKLEDFPVYPAAWADHYSHLLVVTASNQIDGILGGSKKPLVNFSDAWVKIAAPGEKIKAAQPRNEYDEVSSSSIAAAVVVGALVRIGADTPSELKPETWVNQLLNRAKEVKELKPFVKNGLRLQLQ